MYAALWRLLPGPWWVRVIILVVAAAAVLAACVFWIFPWVNVYIEPTEIPTVDQ